VRVRRGEHDLAPAPLVGDDQILVALEMPAPPINILEQQTVQVQHERHGQRLVMLQSHDVVDRVTVTGELLLVAVAKTRAALGYP